MLASKEADAARLAEEVGASRQREEDYERQCIQEIRRMQKQQEIRQEQHEQEVLIILSKHYDNNEIDQIIILDDKSSIVN